MDNVVNIMGDGPNGQIIVTGGSGDGPLIGVPPGINDDDLAAMLRQSFDTCAALCAQAHAVGIRASFNIGDASNGFKVSCVLQKIVEEKLDEKTRRVTVRDL